MNATERILGALEGHGCKPRQSKGGWSARCPAHDDRRASLSISVGHHGGVVVYCHAGCPTETVVQTLGLGMADLMPESDARSNGRPTDAPRRPRDGRDGGGVFPNPETAQRALEAKLGPVAACWTYHDAHSEPVGMVLRWDTPSGKEIRPLAHGPDGWRIGAMPGPRPLYGLPEILQADPSTPIVVLEGEKAADAARQCGMVATTSVGGAKAASKTDWGPLRGRRVLILPDNDSAGESYAQDVARLAHAAGAREVKIVRLADYARDLPEGGDLADIMASDTWCGLPLADSALPEHLGEWIHSQAERIQPWRPEAVVGQSGSSTVPPRAELVLVRASDVQPEGVAWLWPGRIPLGRITLLVGRPGAGKSFLTCDMAARISTGNPWPDADSGLAPGGDVLLVCAEDNPSDTIRPRLDAAGADCQRVFIAQAARVISDDGKERMVAFTLSNVELIADALARLPECRMVVLDPIGHFLGGQVDAHRDNEVRAVLAPLADIAAQRNVAVVLVAHTRKATVAFADDAAIGSRAFTGLARSVLHVMGDSEDADRKLLLPGKCNLAAPPPGLAFRITGLVPRIEWEPNPVMMRADDAVAAMASPTKPGPEAEALETATLWLKAALANGPQLAKELREEWTEGHGGSLCTLKRAKAKLGVAAFRREVPGPWWWAMDSEAKGINPSKLKELEPLEPLAKNTGKTTIFEA